MKKRGLSPVIATILLILVTVSAIVMISRFLIPWVKDSLSNTNCIKAMGLLEIKDDPIYTCNSTDSNEVRVMMELKFSDKELDISGLKISLFGKSQGSVKSKVFNIKNDSVIENVRLYEAGKTYADKVELPNQGEIRTYAFNTQSLDLDVESVTAALILEQDKICEAINMEINNC